MRGERILLDIYTLESGETMPTSTGLRQIKAGLSYPTDEAPEAYCEAWRQCKEGLHCYTGLAEQSALYPWTLKSSDFPVDVEWETDTGTAITCTVQNSKVHLNESNLLILKSRLPGAGLGLFLRPTPPTTRGCLKIPSNRLICEYSNQPITEDEAEGLECTDYLFQFESTRVRYFNPVVYDGRNIGRFINHGGLKEGLIKLCQVCDREHGSTGYVNMEVRREFERCCNVTYKQKMHSTLCVHASKELVSCEHPQELLGNYGVAYWLRYVAENYSSLPQDSVLVRTVLWTLLSENSAYDGEPVDTSRIPEDVIERYRTLRCPFPAPRSR